jgi:hypothetical protein
MVDPFCLADRTAALCRVDRTPVETPTLGAAAPMEEPDHDRDDSAQACGAWAAEARAVT